MGTQRKVTDPIIEEKLNGFKAKLTESGYAPRTVMGYACDVRIYLLTGLPATKESVKKYFDGLKEGVTERKRLNNIRKQRVSALRYCDYLDGNEEKLQGWRHYFNIRKEKRVCNEDCFNCIYPDCIMY